MKNKYVLWTSIGVIVVAIGASSFFVRHNHHGSKKVKYSFDSSQAANGQNTTVANNQTTPALIQTDSKGNPVISQNSSATTPNSPQVAGDATSSSNTAAASKLLDPTTFSQYDSYKNATSASYIDLQTGTGAALTSGHKAAVYYRGWLTNGTLFDESNAGTDGKLQPFVFELGAQQVIAGWEQGLNGMKAGGVRLLIIPPSVGYGATAQSTIPANSVLVFQVQLAEVQ